MRSILRQKQQLVHRARMQGVLNHPKARKIRQLQKNIRRTDARHKCLLSLKARRNHDEEQLFWIAAAMQRLGSSANRNSYTASPAQIQNLGSDDAPGLLPIVMEAIVHIYINRNDEELRELKAKRQPPRGEIRKIEGQKEKELNQFTNGNGFLVPPFSTRSEIEVVLEWMEAVMEFEEATISGKLDTNLTEEEKKLLTKQMPKLAPAYVLRESVKTSKKGNVSPSDDFLQLVEQLKNQDGIGNHLLDDDEDNDENENDNNHNNNNEDNSEEILDDFDMCADLAERKKKRRRFGKLRKVSSSEDDGSNNGNNNSNSNSNSNSKAINIQGMALDGMARRYNADRASRDQRRKDALQQARMDNDSD